MKFLLFVQTERLAADVSQEQLYYEMPKLCRITDDGGMHAI